MGDLHCSGCGRPVHPARIMRKDGDARDYHDRTWMDGGHPRSEVCGPVLDVVADEQRLCLDREPTAGLLCELPAGHDGPHGVLLTDCPERGCMLSDGHGGGHYYGDEN